MVYLFYGNDTAKSHKELKSLVAEFLKGGKDRPVFRIDEESFSEPFFNDLLKTEDLFFGRKLVVSKRLLGQSQISEYILKNLSHLCSASGVFVFWEEDTKSDILNVFKKEKAEIKEFFSAKEGKKAPKGDKKIFQITDSFSSRQKERTWLLCEEAFMDGIPVEDVFWKIFWQVKNILAVKDGGGAGLHPFVYKKAEKASSNFSAEELGGFSEEMVALYHENRLGRADMETGLEKIVLRL